MNENGSGAITLTVRLPKELVGQLDAEMERRSLLAGAPGLLSRNAMVRLALESGLSVLKAGESVQTKKPKTSKKRARIVQDAASDASYEQRPPERCGTIHGSGGASAVARGRIGTPKSGKSREVPLS